MTEIGSDIELLQRLRGVLRRNKSVPGFCSAMNWVIVSNKQRIRLWELIARDGEGKYQYKSLRAADAPEYRFYWFPVGDRDIRLLYIAALIRNIRNS